MTIMKRLMIIPLALAMLLIAACASPAEAPAAEPEAPAVAPVEEAEPVEHNYDLAEGEELYLEGVIFTEDVTISGDSAAITFAGCEFPGDVILKSEIGTRAMLMDCAVAGNCVFDNGAKEGSMDTDMPKFIVNTPVDVITEDCYGSVVALGDFEITYNGNIHTLAESELFFDNSNPEAGFVPYEGQEANLFYVGKWWENGEQIMFLYCEYDPGM